MATDSLGTRIRRARERLRWTQQELATRIGKSLRTVNDWENDRSKPKSAIGALEDVLGVRLTGNEPEPLISPELRALIERQIRDPQRRADVIRYVEETVALERGASLPSREENDPGRRSALSRPSPRCRAGGALP